MPCSLITYMFSNKQSLTPINLHDHSMSLDEPDYDSPIVHLVGRGGCYDAAAYNA